MMVKTCPQCGTVFETGRADKKFCTRECMKKSHGKNTGKARVYQQKIQCPHNEGVDCTVKNCYHCGWNPKLAKIRMDRILREAGV